MAYGNNIFCFYLTKLKIKKSYLSLVWEILHVLFSFHIRKGGNFSLSGRYSYSLIFNMLSWKNLSIFFSARVFFSESFAMYQGLQYKILKIPGLFSAVLSLIFNMLSWKSLLFFFTESAKMCLDTQYIVLELRLPYCPPTLRRRGL